MIIKLENPTMFAKVVDILSELVSEVRIKVNEFGLSVTAMDPANISMVNFKIPRSAFAQFESGNENLGINLDNLKQILRRCSVGSSLILEKNENNLKISIQDRINRRFTLGLIDVESEDINFEEKVSRIEFTSIIEMNSVDLVNSIEDCAIVSDACSLKIENEKFIIEAKSLNSAMSEFSGDEVKMQAEDCKAKYSIEYLQKFMKGAKICDKTSLRFAEDSPLRIDFKNPGIELNFILAPRVETDD